ncbi:MAG: hypothetical protein K0V04_41175 [Deltaproteobacteria bacterium]|nr:hypothetical protein [Deltaproteobacteria bacterium]
MEALPVGGDRLMRRAGAVVIAAGLSWRFALASTEAHAHRGLHNLAGRHACEHLELGDDCSWTDAEHARYIGTCRKVATSLLCVRNRPIERQEEGHHDHAEGHHEHGGHGHGHGSHGHGSHDHGHGGHTLEDHASADPPSHVHGNEHTDHGHGDSSLALADLWGRVGFMAGVTGIILVLFGGAWRIGRRRRGGSHS